MSVSYKLGAIAGEIMCASEIGGIPCQYYLFTWDSEGSNEGEMMGLVSGKARGDLPRRKLRASYARLYS